MIKLYMYDYFESSNRFYIYELLAKETEDEESYQIINHIPFLIVNNLVNKNCLDKVSRYTTRMFSLDNNKEEIFKKQISEFMEEKIIEQQKKIDTMFSTVPEVIKL